jgi:hypothetical protein
MLDAVGGLAPGAWPDGEKAGVTGVGDGDVEDDGGGVRGDPAASGDGVAAGSGGKHAG